MPHTILDLRTWEEFEEKKLKELQEKAEEEHGPDLLYRGQGHSCWPVTTTLERSLDGQEMSFLRYYESIYRAKPKIESYPESPSSESWEVPPPGRLGHKLGNREPFARFTEEDFRTWGLVWTYMVHLRHHGFPSPFLDWTRSPYIAAFFAFRQPIRDGEKVSIFVYREKPNPTYPKVFSSDRPEIRILPKQYVRTNRRHFLQQCEYTMCIQAMCMQNRDCEWCFVPHEGVFERDDPKVDILWEFNLPATERRKVLRLLDRFNLNAFSLFGSEESLMETMAFRELGQ